MQNEDIGKQTKLTELEKMHAEISHLMAQTAKVNKDLKWYEVMIVVAVTLAIVAIVKLFLV